MSEVPKQASSADDLRQFLGGRKFGTILADPPWRFAHRTGKVAPEHNRLTRYGTMAIEEIKALPVAEAAADVMKGAAGDLRKVAGQFKVVG